MDRCNLFNSYPAAVSQFKDLDTNGKLPDDIFVAVYHRRFIKKTHYFFQPYQPQILAMPIVLLLPLKPTGKRIYEEVWAMAQQILKFNSPWHLKQN